MKKERIIEIIDKYTTQVFPCDVSPEEWIAAKNCMINILNRKNNDLNYKWHNLRSNPNDLPDSDKRIIFHIIYMNNEFRYYTGCYSSDCDGFFNDDAEQYVTSGYYPIENVIGWKYIEPFDICEVE